MKTRREKAAEDYAARYQRLLEQLYAEYLEWRALLRRGISPAEIERVLIHASRSQQRQDAREEAISISQQRQADQEAQRRVTI